MRHGYDPIQTAKAGNPTFVTELDSGVLESVKKEFYDTKKMQNASRNLNNFIPVEQMNDGQMGISLNSLSLVIHKVFNQIYGLTERADAQTQTVAGVSIFSADTRRKMDYLIRGMRNSGIKNKKGIYTGNPGWGGGQKTDAGTNP